MTKTFNMIAYGRKLTLENVDTYGLNEGDALYHMGCLMVCGEFGDRNSLWGETLVGDGSDARWCDAVVTGHDEGSIPNGWMAKTEDGLFRTWRIQGNKLASWSRVVSNVPADDQPMRFKMSHGPDGDIRMSRQA